MGGIGSWLAVMQPDAYLVISLLPMHCHMPSARLFPPTSSAEPDESNPPLPTQASLCQYLHTPYNAPSLPKDRLAKTGDKAAPDVLAIACSANAARHAARLRGVHGSGRKHDPLRQHS